MRRPPRIAPPLATLFLLAWLPAVKAALPAGEVRFVLFYGGGALLAAWAVRREPAPLSLRPLFARPLRGLAEGALGFALLLAAAGLLLSWPALGPWLPAPLGDLIALFDPRPTWLAWRQGVVTGAEGAIGAAGAATIALGAVAEEWIFRVALFWRWLPRQATSAALVSGAPATVESHLPGWGVAGRLLAVSCYFAVLHWPQPPAGLLVALLGSLALGGLLLWRRNFALVALLHVLFNWKTLGW